MKETIDMEKTFGEFFKKKRVESGLSLRGFCKKYNLDAGNLSKIERGIMPPPKDKVAEYAGHLDLKKGGSEWNEFIDLAAISADKIPDGFKQTDVYKKLPVFCRGVRDKRITKKEIDEIISIIEKANSK